MEDHTTSFYSRSHVIKKDYVEKVSDAQKRDLSQRSETMSIPDVILESLKSDYNSSIAKLTDLETCDMTSQLGNAVRPLSDITNFSDSGGSKDEIQRSWTNLSHISTPNTSNVQRLIQRDQVRSKSWDPKEIRLLHRKSVELMRLLEDEEVNKKERNAGRRTSLRYSSITTLNSVDDFEPRFCTSKTISLNEENGITVEIKNSVPRIVGETDPMIKTVRPVETFRSPTVEVARSNYGNIQPASVSVKVGKENQVYEDPSRPVKTYARIFLKQPEEQTPSSTRIQDSVKGVDMHFDPPTPTVVPRPKRVSLDALPKKYEGILTPVHSRRASASFLTRSSERQSFDSKMSFFPVAKPRTSLMKSDISPDTRRPTAQPTPSIIDPIYANHDDIGGKISLSRILRAVTSPTPSEEKDLTPPWRNPSNSSLSDTQDLRKSSIDSKIESEETSGLKTWRSSTIRTYESFAKPGAIEEPPVKVSPKRNLTENAGFISKIRGSPITPTLKQPSVPSISASTSPVPTRCIEEMTKTRLISPAKSTWIKDPNEPKNDQPILTSKSTIRIVWPPSAENDSASGPIAAVNETKWAELRTNHVESKASMSVDVEVFSRVASPLNALSPIRKAVAMEDNENPAVTLKTDSVTRSWKHPMNDKENVIQNSDNVTKTRSGTNFESVVYSSATSEGLTSTKSILTSPKLFKDDTADVGIVENSANVAKAHTTLTNFDSVVFNSSSTEGVISSKSILTPPKFVKDHIADVGIVENSADVAEAHTNSSNFENAVYNSSSTGGVMSSKSILDLPKVVAPPRKKKVAFKLSNSTSSPVISKRFDFSETSSGSVVHFGDISGDFLWKKEEPAKEAETISTPKIQPEADDPDKNKLRCDDVEPPKMAVGGPSNSTSIVDSNKYSLSSEIQSSSKFVSVSEEKVGMFDLSSDFFITSQKLEMPNIKQGKADTSLSEKFSSGGKYRPTSPTFPFRKTAPSCDETQEANKPKGLVSEDASSQVVLQNSTPKPTERMFKLSKRVSTYVYTPQKQETVSREKIDRGLLRDETNSEFTLVDVPVAIPVIETGCDPSGPTGPVKPVDLPNSAQRELCSQKNTPSEKEKSLEAIPPTRGKFYSQYNEIIQEKDPRHLSEKLNTVPLAKIKSRSVSPKKHELPQFLLGHSLQETTPVQSSRESVRTDVSDAFREILLHRKGQKMTSLPDDSIYTSPSLNSDYSNGILPASEPAYSVYGSTVLSPMFSNDESSIYEAICEAVTSRRRNVESSLKMSPAIQRSDPKKLAPSVSNYEKRSGQRIYEHPTKKGSILGSTFERSKSLEHHNKAIQEDFEFKMRSLPKESSAFEKRFLSNSNRPSEPSKPYSSKKLPQVEQVTPSTKSPPRTQRKGSMERRSERFRKTLQDDFRTSAKTNSEAKNIEDIVKVEGNDLATSLETLIAMNQNETDCDDRRTSSISSAITVRENKSPKHYLSFVSIMSRPKAKARRKLFSKEEKMKLSERFSQGSSADGWSETSSIIHTSFAAGDSRSDRQSSVFEYVTSKVKGSQQPVAPPRRKPRKAFVPPKGAKSRVTLRSYRSSISLPRSDQSSSLRGSQSYSDLKIAVSRNPGIVDEKSPGVNLGPRGLGTVAGSMASVQTATASTPSLIGAQDDFLKSLQQLAGALENSNIKWGVQEH